jgi:hypothetical protein
MTRWQWSTFVIAYFTTGEHDRARLDNGLYPTKKEWTLRFPVEEGNRAVRMCARVYQTSFFLYNDLCVWFDLLICMCVQPLWKNVWICETRIPNIIKTWNLHRQHCIQDDLNFKQYTVPLRIQFDGWTWSVDVLRFYGHHRGSICLSTGTQRERNPMIVYMRGTLTIRRTCGFDCGCWQWGSLKSMHLKSTHSFGSTLITCTVLLSRFPLSFFLISSWTQLW